MLRRAYRWLDERLDLGALSRQHLEYLLPPGVNWLHTLGSAALFLFLLQVITGIFLAIYYVPTPDHAYESVQYLSTRIAFGGFIRGVHYWASNLMVVIVLLHLLRVFCYGAYKKPREANWVVGVLLLLVVLGFGFTGYLLPWDQKGYWATVVGTNLPRTIPLVGDFLAELIRGGREVGAVALARFYAAHTLLLPLLAFILIALHLFLMRRLGVAGSWRGEAGYAERRMPFYPDHAAKDATVALVLFGVIVLLALVVGAPTERRADPTDITFNPRPEWYFLFLFELLRYFRGRWEVIGAVVIPLVLTLVLLLLPFYDRRAERSPLRRPLASGLMLAGLAAFVALTLMGGAPEPTERAVAEVQVVKALPKEEHELTEEQILGRELVETLDCLDCHEIKGVGLKRGPDLTHAGLKLQEWWVLEHFKDPQAFVPDSEMPAYDYLSDEELEALTAYVMSLE